MTSNNMVHNPAPIANQTHSKPSGFTLVELLVVVAVIAMLMAILVPALQRARVHAKLVACQTNMRTLGQANGMYAQDYNVFVPNWGFWHTVPGTTWGNWTNSKTFLSYVGFTQQELSNIFLDSNKNAAGTTWPKRFQCPAWHKIYIPWDHELSYGYTNAYNNTSYGQQGIPPFEIVGASTKIQFTDAQNWMVNMGGGDYKNIWDVYGECFVTSTRNSDFATMYRHDEGANYTYWDLHVEYGRKQDMFHYKPETSELPDNAVNNRLWDIKNN